ncbi:MULTISPECIES: extracellular solute-binding protein [Clostridia]|uniref:extracellular solute-binding protein n=1 Tax=Clostridia TaxID=186801 RepID=UPI000EA07DC8|nr:MULTISPECIES: extracellular solute-binding protein [Clostridia]NBJ68855.1 extracellular solute-binding protein [Roseburia sp. 1XD42-34]RKI80232.1 extracellular solute-binding protein [Clostridium sp. 1xD42-85]
MRVKLLFVTMLSVMMLVACSNNEKDKQSEAKKKSAENVNKTEMPIVEEPITLKFFANKSPNTADDWNDVLLYNEYEKMTNIDIEWEMVPSQGMAEKRNLALASGSLPDAFHSTSISFADLQKYGEQGTFIPLNDLIENYAPNLKKILEDYPEIKKAITMPDGNIYAFPYLFEPEFTSVLIGARPWIREDWLKALEMDTPETVDDFYKYLKAVKENDPNGNKKADEIPFGGTSIDRLIAWLSGAYGLQNRGARHPYVDVDSDSNKLRFVPTSDEYKEMLQFIHQLYKEGLIEENIFTIENNQYLANGSKGLYGSTVYHSPDMLFGDIGEKYTGASALEGPFGDKLYSRITSPVMAPGAFAITSANKHPEATVRWVDYFYGDEGAKLFFMGVEGKTYEEKEDGSLEYVDEIKNNPEGLTFEQAIAKYLTFPGGFYPALVKEAYFKGSETTKMSQEAVKKLEPHIIEEIWPEFVFTSEETKVLDSVGNDIHKYITEMRDKFIVGDVPFSEWDKYGETLEKMGLEEYMDIQQAAHKRLQEK